MKDRRAVDELTIEELEEILRLRKRKARLERLRTLNQKEPRQAVDPLAPEPIEPRTSPRPQDHRKFQDEGATAQYRAHTVAEDGAASKKAPSEDKRPIRWDWVRDKSLLVIEVTVLLGLVAVLITAMATLHRVNETSSQAQTLPTLTPTPPIQVILPGGHKPPDESGTSAPAEIPSHLRNLVSEVTPMPVPTRGPEQAVRIQIPAIEVDAPVLEGDDWETLKRGVGHHIGSANPGERGNCILSAHNDIFGEIFRDLPDLNLGDEVVVHTASRSYRYEVTQSRIIEPTEVSVMEDTSSPILTLISCYPYGIDTHRIVVIGELKP
jgi:sortase A